MQIEEKARSTEQQRASMCPVAAPSRARHHRAGGSLGRKQVPTARSPGSPPPNAAWEGMPTPELQPPPGRMDLLVEPTFCSSPNGSMTVGSGDRTCGSNPVTASVNPGQGAKPGFISSSIKWGSSKQW